MPQSLAQIYLHLVFSTKNRQPFLKDRDFRSRLQAYLVGICKNLHCPSLQIGGVEDHVHILCRFGKGIEVQNLLRDLKRDSSLWVKTQMPSLDEFHWQAGYGAFSVSPAHVEALIRYIANQEEHHRKVSYQHEFRRICKKYGVELDESVTQGALRGPGLWSFTPSAWIYNRKAI
jgi:putative transposase